MEKRTHKNGALFFSSFSSYFWSVIDTNLSVMMPKFLHTVMFFVAQMSDLCLRMRNGEVGGAFPLLCQDPSPAAYRVCPSKNVKRKYNIISPYQTPVWSPSAK